VNEFGALLGDVQKFDSYELQLSGLLQDLACSFFHLRDGG